MTRARIVTLFLLVTLLIFFMIGVGAYHLWATGWAFWAWWPMGLCLARAYFLGWRWQRQIRARQAEAPPPMHWTDRDRLAWKLVEERVKAADKIADEKFGDPKFYFDTAQEMASQLSKV